MCICIPTELSFCIPPLVVGEWRYISCYSYGFSTLMKLNQSFFNCLYTSLHWKWKVDCAVPHLGHAATMKFFLAGGWLKKLLTFHKKMKILPIFGFFYSTKRSISRITSPRDKFEQNMFFFYVPKKRKKWKEKSFDIRTRNTNIFF